MKVYGLSGKSGTGKSYQAINICRENHIECIIDDGLLISGNSILAGVSAKRQPTKIGATKTALFSEEAHRQEVAAKIKEYNPESILIIGTSDSMVNKIVQKLELPKVHEMIHITDITTEEEREIANKQRNELGKHIIPVPTFQIKPDFSGYFMYPLKIFKKGGKAASEKSVVRPTYSYLGEYTISEKVITDIVEYLGGSIHGVSQILKVTIDNNPRGVSVYIAAVMEFGHNVIEIAERLQKAIVTEVEIMTAFNILKVDIDVKGLRRDAS